MGDRMIKPCPCCGSEAKYKRYDDDCGVGITCTKCGLNVFRKISDEYAAKDAVMDAWNNRSGLDEPEEKTLEVGDTLFFGRYPQEADGTVKAVEWRILKIEDGIAACISKYGLDASCFDKSGKYNGYENSTLSDKVDEMFCQMFNALEELCVEAHRLDDKGYSALLYILSKEEAEELFDSDEDRICEPTSYAKSKSVYFGANSCFWWLRSHGGPASAAASVGVNGNIAWHSDVSNSCYVVRPAMKLDLEVFNRMTKEKEGI